MRKYIIAVVVLLVSLALAGCGEVKTPTTTTEIQDTKVQETTTQETMPETMTQETTTPTQTRNLDEELYQMLLADCEHQENLDEYPDTIENEILYEFLTRPNDEGYYVVIDQNTTLWEIIENDDDFNDLVIEGEYIIEWFNMFEYDISELYAQLLELNRNQHRLTIRSNLSGGYYINYNEKFDGYCEELLAGVDVGERNYWQIMHYFFPHYEGSFRASLPAYDPNTGYVLIFSSWASDWLMGMGELHLLKYQDGDLNKIISYELWVS